MNKKMIPIIVIALLVPLAVIAYIINDNLKGKLSDGSIIECILTVENEPISIKDEESVNTVIAAIENGENISGPANPIESYRKISVELKKLNSSFTYTFYLSESVNDCIYCDSEGKYFRITAENAEKLLAIKEIESDVVSYLDPPKVSVISGETAAVCGTVHGKWSAKKDGGEFSTSEISKSSNEIYILPKSDALKFECKFTPDFCDIKIMDAITEELLFDGEPDKLSSFSLDADRKILIIINCEWYEKSDLNYYGKLEYSFDAFYDIAASCKLSAENLSCGDTLIIKISNTSSTNTAITSSAFASRPEMITVGSDTYAIIQIPMSTADGAYTVSVLGSDIEQNININITKGNHAAVDFPIDINMVLTACLEKIKLGTSEKEFKLKENLSSPVSPERAVINGSAVSPDGSNVFDLMAYQLDAGTPVGAAGDGICCFSGDIAGIGRTIIISHGAEIYSVYIGLNDNTLLDKTPVTKDMQISSSGNTLYFGLIAGNNFVNASNMIGFDLMNF